jgi:hypothetical protein
MCGGRDNSTYLDIFAIIAHPFTAVVFTSVKNDKS